MKSFKIREGKMLVDCVFYSDKPSDVKIKGKLGMIHSINVGGKQMFPYGGQFDDGTIPVVDSTTDVLDSEPTTKKRAKATKMVESNGEPLDEKGNLIGKKKRAKK
jgi:hypothetical protein